MYIHINNYVYTKNERVCIMKDKAKKDSVIIVNDINKFTLM